MKKNKHKVAVVQQGQITEKTNTLQKVPYGTGLNGSVGDGMYQFILDVVDWQSTISSQRPLTPPKNRYHYFLRTKTNTHHFADNDLLSEEEVFGKFQTKLNNK